MTANAWADAINVTFDTAGVPSRPSIAAHIRSALRAAGVLRRAQITRGLNEAYSPFGPDGGAVRQAVQETLNELLLIGDVTELDTAGGAAYLLTPPRLIVTDPECGVVLGASDIEPGTAQVARRLNVLDWPGEDALIRLDLRSEIGLPDWRLGLVELGGADDPIGAPVAFFDHVARLSAAGDRLSDLSPDRVRVLGGRQQFFGRHDAAQLEGRWAAANRDGVFCAVRHAGYHWCAAVLTIQDGGASLWEAENWDHWRWAVVGQTLSEGCPVVGYATETGELAAYVPLPRQIRRLLATGAEPVGSWRWRCTTTLAELARELLTGHVY